MTSANSVEPHLTQDRSLSAAVPRAGRTPGNADVYPNWSCNESNCSFQLRWVRARMSASSASLPEPNFACLSLLRLSTGMAWVYRCDRIEGQENLDPTCAAST